MLLKIPFQIFVGLYYIRKYTWEFYQTYSTNSLLPKLGNARICVILIFSVLFLIPTFLYAYIVFNIMVIYCIFLQIPKSSVPRIHNEQLINIPFNLFYSILIPNTIDLLGIENDSFMWRLEERFYYKALWLSSFSSLLFLSPRPSALASDPFHLLSAPLFVPLRWTSQLLCYPTRDSTSLHTPKQNHG